MHVCLHPASKCKPWLFFTTLAISRKVFSTNLSVSHHHYHYNHEEMMTMMSSVINMLATNFGDEYNDKNSTL